MVSAAFKFLCKGDLSEGESKEYASKNILLNIYAVFRETVIAIENNPKLKKFVNSDRFKEMKENLIVEIDNSITEIMINLADNYPQAPASGGTPRMREVITDVNRVED